MKTSNLHSFFALLLAGFALTSCNQEGCTDSAASNYDSGADSDDGSCDYDVITPAEYVFTDANGNNTVNFDGQRQRLNMLSEMTTYLKSSNTPGTSVDATTLLAMYGNDGYTWNDDQQLGMTGSSKQLRSKTAGGDTYWTETFEGFMTGIADASAQTVEGETSGAAGVSGVVGSSTSSSQYLQSAQGQEWTQLIEKGLMGACFYYNISSVYLASGKMDVDNSTAVDAADDKFYTEMEHHWDEAYGYFTDATDYPTNGANRFWGKYADGREDLLNSASRLSAAFRKGRAAISQNRLAERDAQIEIINRELERCAAGTAIHYLNDALGNYADDALRNHELSEAKAFIMALQFGANTSVNTDAVNTLLGTLGEDYYTVTTAQITQVRDDLAALTGLTEFASNL
ncbi:MAG: DUF4856 domain-containing protein [Crocinitomicaceae bacterium]|nr:DUF4856 domain-containing protein [Crocinitomicaceae bacterium]